MSMKFEWKANFFIQENAFEYVVCEMAPFSLGLNEWIQSIDFVACHCGAVWGHGLFVIYHDVWVIKLIYSRTSGSWKTHKSFITLLLLFSFVQWSLQMFLYYERKRQLCRALSIVVSLNKSLDRRLSCLWIIYIFTFLWCHCSVWVAFMCHISIAMICSLSQYKM